MPLLIIEHIQVVDTVGLMHRDNASYYQIDQVSFLDEWDQAGMLFLVYHTAFVLG